MCGRYAASASQDLLVETFEIDEVVDLPASSWNVAPTDPVPAVVERKPRVDGDSDEPEDREPVRKLVAPRWGLVPSWSKSAKSGASMINARVETVATKPAFRRAFSSRRCLLPAEGYYEWYDTQLTDAKGKPVKQPFFIRPADERLLVMAGIYEFWKDPDSGEWLTSCAVITTTATDSLGHIHDRMPMVIGPESWDAWLDPSVTDPDQAMALLSVTAADQLEAYAVSRAVGNVRNNSPDLVEPIEES